VFTALAVTSCCCFLREVYLHLGTPYSSVFLTSCCCCLREVYLHLDTPYSSVFLTNNRIVVRRRNELVQESSD
jgi:hypothetical protein